MAEKSQKHWDSLELRKRKVDSISRYQIKILQVEAEHCCDADQSSTSIENERSVLEEIMAEDNFEIHNNNRTNTQHPSGNSLQSSANSSEVIDDTDEEIYCENAITFSDKIREQSKVNIKLNEKVSKRDLKRYLRSTKFGENSVVSTKNNIIFLPSQLAISQNQKLQEFNAQTTSNEILTDDVIQDMPPDDVLFPPEPELKKITPTTPIGEVLTADVIQDMPPGDVVFASEPELKKITQSTPIDEVLTADGIQDIPLGDVVFAFEPEIKKITQTTPFGEVLTADVIQDMPPGGVVLASEPEIKKMIQTTAIDEVLTAGVIQDISCTEIVTDNVSQSLLFQQPQVYTTLETVVFECEPKDIEDNKGSSLSLINIFNTSSFDPTTDISDHDMNSEHPTSTKKNHNKIIKSYVDYLSDNEDSSAGNSDVWSMNESESSINSGNKKKKCTKKKQKIIDKNKKRTNTIENLIKHKTKKNNKSKLRKQLKNAGKSYETRSGSKIEEKSMKVNPCIPGICARKCNEVSEERKLSLFIYFWNLDVQRRKDWIVRCAQPIPIK